MWQNLENAWFIGQKLAELALITISVDKNIKKKKKVFFSEFREIYEGHERKSINPSENGKSEWRGKDQRGGVKVKEKEEK